MTYKVNQLFHTSWQELGIVKHLAVHKLNETRKQLPIDQQGIYIIMILRQLRKRQWLFLLTWINYLRIDRLTEVQAVDIFNDLKFLDEPWMYFQPATSKMKLLGYDAPAEKMGNLTFDHFIYADNEFTSLAASRLERELYWFKRLTYILYKPEFSALRIQELNVSLTFAKLAFYTFGNIRNYIVSNCVHFFDGSPQSGRVKPSLALWTQIKYKLAEHGTFGSFAEVGKQPLYVVINYLEEKSKENANAAKTH